LPTRASKGRPSRGTLSKARPSNAWMYFFGSQTDSLCYGCALLILHSKIRLCLKSSGCQNQTNICPLEFRTAEHPPRDTGREFERKPSTRRDTLLAGVSLFQTKFQMVGHEGPCPVSALGFRLVCAPVQVQSCQVALLLLPVVTCDDARCESLIALGVGCSDLRLGSCPVSDIFSCHH